MGLEEAQCPTAHPAIISLLFALSHTHAHTSSSIRFLACLKQKTLIGTAMHDVGSDYLSHFFSYQSHFGLDNFFFLSLYQTCSLCSFKAFRMYQVVLPPQSAVFLRVGDDWLCQSDLSYNVTFSEKTSLTNKTKVNIQSLAFASLYLNLPIACIIVRPNLFSFYSTYYRVSSTRGENASTFFSTQAVSA